MMKKRKTIFAMIPARMGSTRLPMKNLALLGGKPLIYYAIRTAKEADIFDRIVLNSEHTLFSEIARRYKVEFYKRPAQLATSKAKSDFVVYDFVKKNPCDIVVWVNPTSPLQTGREIRDVVDFFLKRKLDSLITVKDENVHTIYMDKPVNFRMDDIFARTQDIKPVRPFVYSVMMWRTSVFIRVFEKKGHALFCGKIGFYPVSRLSAIIIKRKEDLMLADYIMRSLSRRTEYKLSYDRLLSGTKKRARN